MSLITDLGIVIACAAAVTLLFHRLKLPIFLSYILAGVLLGPNLFPYSPIKDLATVQQLSELGVIFLMFYIGMEFDLRRLSPFLGPALLAVGIQTVVLIFLGIQTAPILGWGRMDGFFLGALLAISSSMVTVAVLKDFKALQSSYAQLTIAVLILEDILAVTLLVLLSGMAIRGHLEWEGVGWAIFLVGVFGVSVYFIGRVAASGFLAVLQRKGNPDMLTLCAVGLLMAVSVLAERFDFSVALGAFLAGSILSTSRLCGDIQKATDPFRTVFSAVFFVSVGMLIEPRMLLDQWKAVLLISVLVCGAKVGACWLGFFLGGTRAVLGFKAAVAKAQIGEFSFVIAGLGQTLGVTHPGLMALAVGVALLTILTTPLIVSRADYIYASLSRHTPRGVKILEQFYQDFIDAVTSRIGGMQLLQMVKRPILQVVVYFFLLNGIIAITALLSTYVQDWTFVQQGAEVWVRSAVWFLAALACGPFMVSVMRNLDVIVMMVTEVALSATAIRQVSKDRLRSLFHRIIFSLTLVLVGGIFLTAAAPFLPSGVALGVFLALIAGVGVVFWRWMVYFNSQLEYRFLKGFSEDSMDRDQARRVRTLEELDRKYPWPINVEEVSLEASSSVCGKRIRDLKLHSRTGASIIAIGRSGHVCYDPSPETSLFPSDQVFLFGTKDQNRRAVHLLKSPAAEPPEAASTTFKIEKIYLGRQSPFVGETLSGSQLRSRHQINVLGIQRGEERIIAPAPDEVLKSGDVLYVVGLKEAIRELQGDVE